MNGYKVSGTLNLFSEGAKALEDLKDCLLRGTEPARDDVSGELMLATFTLSENDPIRAIISHDYGHETWEWDGEDWIPEG